MILHSYSNINLFCKVTKAIDPHGFIEELQYAHEPNLCIRISMTPCYLYVSYNEELLQ